MLEDGGVVVGFIVVVLDMTRRRRRGMGGGQQVEIRWVIVKCWGWEVVLVVGNWFVFSQPQDLGVVRGGGGGGANIGECVLSEIGVG